MKSFQLLLILAIGAVLRFYNNTAVALWHDEAFSALYIKYSWSEMMYRIGLDVHPPLYYWLLRFWSYIFGHSLLSLRALSIVFGVLTVYAGYLFVRRAFKNEKLAILSALLLAVNPFQIQYALEARMYTLGTFLVLISSWVLIKALEENKRKYWIWYGILAAANVYTHYYLMFFVFAQGLYALYYLLKNRQFNLNNWRENRFINIAFSAIVASLLYVPWFKTFMEQKDRVQESFWIPAMDRWSIPGTIWKMAFGGPGINRPTLAIATIVSVVLLIYFIKNYRNDHKWLVVLGLVVPFAAAILLSLKTAIYLDRYFVFASLFYVIMFTGAFYAIPRFTLRKVLISVLIIITTAVFFKNWDELGVKDLSLKPQVNRKPGMAAASTYINDLASRNDQIYVGSSFIYFTFKYYNQTDIRPLLYSTGPLESIPHFSGTAILTNDDLITDFRIAPTNENVFLLWTTGFGGSKPNVPGNWRVVEEKVYPDTPGFKGDIIVTQYHVN